MLNFWNITGVPFLYCFQSFFILKNQKLVSSTFPHNLSVTVPLHNLFGENLHVNLPLFTLLLFAFLLVAYYAFDTANQQKAAVKISRTSGTNINLNSRNCFPSFRWGVLKEPIAFIRTPKGNLLVDGWYAFARKMQYTADLCMAISWGLATGLLSSMNYFYSVFFFLMICHRYVDDDHEDDDRGERECT